MKSDVIVVAKTKMSHGACVGGLLTNGRFVRLLNASGYNQDEDCEYDVGDVFEIQFVEKANCQKPHVEDIRVFDSEYSGTLSGEELIARIKEIGQAHFWEGSTEVLFNEKIHWTKSGSGYISEDDATTYSVGFWIPDTKLTRSDYKGHVRYSYPLYEKGASGFAGNRLWRSIPYVGFDDPVDEIPSGTLLRVSLARWWKPDDAEEMPERCYLQLSGWYRLGSSTAEEEDDDDLPF